MAEEFTLSPISQINWDLYTFKPPTLVPLFPQTLPINPSLAPHSPLPLYIPSYYQPAYKLSRTSRTRTSQSLASTTKLAQNNGTRLNDQLFVVIDIETTGLSRHYHEIIEIAAAVVRDGAVVEEFHSLVNPGTRIPGFITSLTGITEQMVKEAPKINQILPDFLQLLSDNIFVAHNATFDFGFLNHQVHKHYNSELTNTRLCTRKLANRLVPFLPSKNLQSLCQHFGVEGSGAHRALSDVRATVGVLNNMVGILAGRNIKTNEEIIKFQSSKIRKLVPVDNKIVK